MPSGPYVKALQGVADSSNVLAPPQRAIVLGDGLEFEDAPDVVLTGNGQNITGATRIKVTSGGGVTPSAVVAAIAGQAIAPASVAATGNVSVGGDLSVTGTITQGPSMGTTGSGTTTGAGSATLCSVPLADDSSATLYLALTGYAPQPDHVSIGGFAGVYVDGGVIGGGGMPATAVNTLGLPCDVSYEWAAGALSVKINGPQATIVNVTDNGGGKVSVITTGGITSGITGRNVTISGNGVIDGTAQATYVNATQFDLLGVSFTSSGSGGTVVRTSVPVIDWTCEVRRLASPAP